MFWFIWLFNEVNELKYQKSFTAKGVFFVQISGINGFIPDFQHN
ncbi:hypothetical protein SPHINGO8BC_51627 [Sphingobacterium multivorum]|uniref:Uncharacterized protein n=1 Tax=Sphingobacterium multivorum TaxID=28454 RepID=A0A654D6Z2_SPHMU|nr:hypothetical protein SPHINGO8BC_51627 [Sphingobacterium multivorum]